MSEESTTNTHRKVTHMISNFPAMTIRKFAQSSTNVNTYQIDLRSNRVSKIELDDVLKRTDQYRFDEQRHLHQNFQKTMQNSEGQNSQSTLNTHSSCQRLFETRETMESLQLSDKNPRVDINDRKRREIESKEHTNHRSSKYSDTYRLKVVSCFINKTYQRFTELVKVLTLSIHTYIQNVSNTFCPR